MITRSPRRAAHDRLLRAVAAMFVVFLTVPLPAPATEGPTITSVQVESIGPTDERGLIEVLELQVGRTLDRARLREIITTMYAGGELEWMRVEAAENSDGVDVVVRLSFRSKISQIKVRTKSPVLRVKVRRWLQMEMGDPVTESGIEASRRRVERRLDDRGYVGAVVDAYLGFDRPSNTVAVEFEVTAGAPLTVGSVELEGLDSEDIAAAAHPKFKVGAKLTARLEDRIRTRTEKNLRMMGFWEAEVLDIERRIDDASAHLLLHVEPGARYRLDLEAPPENAKAVGRAIPDPADEEIHPAQTEALAEEVQERLQELGYLLADVTASLEPAAEETVLHLTVDPGPKLKISAVDFPGSEHVSKRQLSDAVLVKTGGTGGRFKQKISSATLEADRKSLEDLYHRQGFPYAVVRKPELMPEEGFGAVQVLFPVEEGLRWIMAEVRIEGLPVETAAELDARPLELADGSPWSPGAEKRAQQRLEEALADSGYPEGRVESEVDTSQPGRAVVVLRIDSGPFVRIGDVIIAGLRHTNEKLVAGVVRRAGVSPGEPLSRRRMLDAQRGLFELGLFRRAELVPMPGQEHRAERNIVVRLEEGEQKSYLFGIGYSDKDAARLIGGWSHLNLLGRAYAFSAEVSFSRNQQRYSLSLRKQRTFGLPIPGHLAIYRTDEVLADRDLLRRGLWIDFGDRLKRPFRPWLRYEYEIIQPENIQIDGPVTYQDEFQESKVASLTPSVEWDTRDNPLAPVRGIFASASVQYAFPAFQADSHFVKAFARGTLYRPLLRGFGAIGLRLGAIKPIGGDPARPENLQIPFAYRFFAGGRNSHRAFNTDSLGIPGQTIIPADPNDPDSKDIPIGGNATFLLNMEYRRRIAGELFASVFLDIGNVWESPSTVQFSDIRLGPGIGLQYRTPAGPLRVEYGWKINREPRESRGQFFVSFGVPF